MKIQLIRNATLKIVYAGKTILIDPMLAPKDSYDPFAGLARNPTVDLKMSMEEVIKDVEMVLITHTHPDHFDAVAMEKLDKNLPLFCQPADEELIKGKGFQNVSVVQKSTTWEEITIERTGGKHGSGEILVHMGEVSGFILKAKNHPSVYIIGDSILIDEVKENIELHQPNIIITNSGGAIIPSFESTPILMNEKETVEVAKLAPQSKVIAVHLESLDHCGVTRKSLQQAALGYLVSIRTVLFGFGFRNR